MVYALTVKPPRLFLLAVGLSLLAIVFWAGSRQPYPSDRTPEGAYLRVAKAVNMGRPEDFFAYLETEAQHACFTILDYRRRSLESIERWFPEPLRTSLVVEYTPLAKAQGAPQLFALYAAKEGWVANLRRDLSGVQKVERRGDRASVETVRGTRYPFRVRQENGIWGLTSFTAKLVAEAERAARDHQMIERAREDYARVSGHKNAQRLPSTGNPH